MTGKDRVGGAQRGPMKAWTASSRPNSVSGSNVVTQASSDTESFESSPSVKSRETSPTASPMCPARRLVPGLSTEELENDPETGNTIKSRMFRITCPTEYDSRTLFTSFLFPLDFQFTTELCFNWDWQLIFIDLVEVDSSFLGYNPSRRDCMSKAAVTHTFRKLKTPSRCRECDSYVYFQGLECIEVCFLLTVWLALVVRLIEPSECYSADWAVTRNVWKVWRFSAGTNGCPAKWPFSESN